MSARPGPSQSRTDTPERQDGRTECNCPACEALSAALRAHVDALAHRETTRREVRAAGRAVDAAHPDRRPK
jgi:hypothetical protein